MTTPAEPVFTVPVATAVPVAPGAPPPPLVQAAASGNNTKEDYFQPLSFTQYLRRGAHVYLGHLDTFLTITVLVSLPVILGYQWMIAGYWGSSWLFHYLILPVSRLVAEGSAVTATALVYIHHGEPIAWKATIQTAVRKRLVSRWILQVVRYYGGFLLAPIGIFTFSTPLLLLQKQNVSLVGCLVRSARLVFLHSIGTFVTTIILSWGVTPLLSWVLRRLVGDLVVGGVGATAAADDEEDDSLDFWSQRRQVQEVIALPLISCLWTILYLNICIQSRRGLTRETLALNMGVQLPPSLAASVY